MNGSHWIALGASWIALSGHACRTRTAPPARPAVAQPSTGVTPAEPPAAGARAAYAPACLAAQPAESTPLTPTARDPLQAQRRDATFSPTGRWVVFTNDDGSFTTLVDPRAGISRNTTEALVAAGTAQRVHLVWTGREFEDRGGDVTPVLFSPDEHRVVGRGRDGHQARVVDLRTGGVQSAIRGDDWQVMFRADSHFLALKQGGCAVHLVDLTNGTHRVASAALVGTPDMMWSTGGLLGWVEMPDGTHESRVRWIDAVGAARGVVDAPTGATISQYTVSPDGRWVALLLAGRGFSMYGLGTPTPRLTTPISESQRLNEWRWNNRGTRLAWTMVFDDPEGGTMFHVVDPASGTEQTFTSASRCYGQNESLLSFDDREIVTDRSCGLGCPSVAWEEVHQAYDPVTGQPTETRPSPVGASYNDDLARHEAESRRLSRRGGGAAPLQLLPDQRWALVGRPGAATLEDRRTGVESVRLQDSGGQDVTAVREAPGGAVLAGIDATGRARVWDTATGALLWTDPATP